MRFDHERGATAKGTKRGFNEEESLGKEGEHILGRRGDHPEGRAWRRGGRKRDRIAAGRLRILHRKHRRIRRVVDGQVGSYRNKGQRKIIQHTLAKDVSVERRLALSSARWLILVPKLASHARGSKIIEQRHFIKLCKTKVSRQKR